MTLLYFTLIFLLFDQLSNAGAGETMCVKIEIDKEFAVALHTHRNVGRGLNGCKCAKPDKFTTFLDDTCTPKRGSKFPAHVAECRCKECELNITLHCTCDEHNKPKSWKATKDICNASYTHNTRSKERVCYKSPPTNAVLDFDRCRRGYDGETAQVRCEFSCRPVQVICKSDTNWHYRNESEKCLGDEGNPFYSGTTPGGLNFTIYTNGNIGGFSCPAGHMVVPVEKNPAKCKSGVITGNFPTCERILTQTSEPTETPTTTELSTYEKGTQTDPFPLQKPSTHEKGIQTEPFPLLEDKVNNTGKNLNPTAPLGWIEYLLIVVIILFLVILTGLWSWYAKDKMRVARLKRAAVDNRNGHP